MSKKNNKTSTSNPITLNTLKLQSPYVCPNCGEDHYAYISKKGKQKGIDFGEYYYEGGLLRKDLFGNWYNCLTCGYEWLTKRNLEK